MRVYSFIRSTMKNGPRFLKETFHFSFFTFTDPNALKPNIVPAAVGGTLGLLTSITVLIIIVVICYRRKMKNGKNLLLHLS